MNTWERRDHNEKGYSTYLRCADFGIASVRSELVSSVDHELKSHDDQNATVWSSRCRPVAGYVVTYVDVSETGKELLRSDVS